MMIRNVTLTACALLAGLSILPSTAQAQVFEYDLILEVEQETGKRVDLPGFPIEDYGKCLREKKKTEIGRVIPRGAIISPGGKSYAATIIGARCVQRDSGTGY